MRYDHYEYHFLNFTTDLENEAGATHMGLYLAWLINRGLVSDEVDTQGVLDRTRSGVDVVVEDWDGNLLDEMLNEGGNAFTEQYYDAQFARDYMETFGVSEDNDAFYTVQDSWENYDKLSAVLDQRLAQFRQD